MKILEVKKRVFVLDQKQLIHIKGGNDGTDSTNILIMEDVDAL